VDVLRPYGVVEMVRTGRVAMVRGSGQSGRDVRRRPGVIGLDQPDASGLSV
jgi:hypothetical protein